MLTEKKILFVDGDEGIRKAISLFFRSRNYHLHTAENATQALAATKKERYDIIICEQFLPDVNGLTFFKRLNNRHYEAIKILITLYADTPTFEDIRKRGIDYLLTKPFSGDEIEMAIISLINPRCIKNDQSSMKSKKTADR